MYPFGWLRQTALQHLCLMRIRPMNHSLSQPCCSCGAWTPPEQVDLDRRIEYLSVTRLDGKPRTQVNIQTSEVVRVYCCKPCWDAASVALAADLDLNITYPSFGFVASCCRCGSFIDRTKSYLCYSIAHMAYPKTGGDFAICKKARDWAVLCHGCAGLPDPEEMAVPIATPLASSIRELA